MDTDTIEKTRQTAALYFKGVSGPTPYALWKSFDADLARDLSLFITGRMYARQKLPHPTRQLVTIAALTVLGKTEELKLHIHAALNVGCDPRHIAETIFQTFVYGGMPATNQALEAFKSVLKEKKMWPLPADNAIAAESAP